MASSRNKENNYEHNNRPNRIPSNRYKARAVKARRNAFNKYSRYQPVSSIGETSLTVKSNSSAFPPANPVNVVINSIFRLTVVGIGMGTILGTILANLDLTKPLFPEFNLPFSFSLSNRSNHSIVIGNNPKEESPANPPLRKKTLPLQTTPAQSVNKDIPFNQELTPLKQKLINLKETYPQLEPGIFLVDLDNGNYVNWNGIAPFPAASTIKIPILVAFFQEIDQGQVFLDEKLTLTESSIGSGSGGMQYQEVGTKYTALATATEMIVNSDNTATNMIIERLGGKEKLNQRFQQWGLESTAINNPLPDLEGTNTTSPRDLAILLAKVNQGQLVSLRSRDRLLDIMEKTKTRTLLPQGLETGANIAHKTGDIGKVLGDAGIVDMTTGKRYIAAILVKRPHNDYTARKLIQEISNTAYQHLKWYLPHPPLQKDS
jgi:beta-lactamase class A